MTSSPPFLLTPIATVVGYHRLRASYLRAKAAMQRNAEAIMLSRMWANDQGAIYGR